MRDAIQSMTGFARTEGSVPGLRWVWELRSVNGRGLEIRLRLPAGTDALEPALRDLTQKALRRGHVNATLQIRRYEAAALQPDAAMLDRVLDLALRLAARIPGAPPPRAETLLALPGVLRAAPPETNDTAAMVAMQQGFAAALDALVADRQAEGARLDQLLRTELNEIASLRGQAVAMTAAQPDQHQTRLRAALDALLQDNPTLPADRIAQEVALLVTKSDVREELDRLDSHLRAASDLLHEARPIGRRLDFLFQEFMRETNTLCSKSASTTLTGIGLRLKAAIDQLREQVQNIE